MQRKIEFYLVGLCAFFTFSILLYGFYLSVYDVKALHWFIQEDTFVEWLQFFLFLSTSTFLFFYIYTKLLVKELKLNSLRFLGLLGLACMFLFGAMEEISWGQRVLQIQTPEAIAQHNKQGEITLHNMEVGGVNINKLVFGKILFIFVLFHNLIIPIASKFKPWLRTKAEDLGLFLPPLSLVAVYAVAAIITQMIDHPRRDEFLEYVGAIHYFTAILMTYGIGIGYSKPLFTTELSKKLFSRFYVVAILFLILSSWIAMMAFKVSFYFYGGDPSSLPVGGLPIMGN